MEYERLIEDKEGGKAKSTTSKVRQAATAWVKIVEIY
jgi:hypothetical protein